MEYSTYLWFGGNFSLDTRLKALKEVGFDSIALLYFDNILDWLGSHEEHAKKVKEYGFKIENIHSPYSEAFKLFSKDEEEALKILNLYKDVVSFASENDIPTVVIHLTNDVTTYPINEDAKPRIRELIDFAKERNIKLAFENLRGDAIDYLYYVLDNFKDDNVGLCYDYGHAHVFLKDDGFELLRKYKDRLFVLHLHGNDGGWDYHRRLRDGNGDLVALKKVLHEINFNCPLALEVIQPVKLESYDEILKYVKEMKEDLEKLC